MAHKRIQALGSKLRCRERFYSHRIHTLHRRTLGRRDLLESSFPFLRRLGQSLSLIVPGSNFSSSELKPFDGAHLTAMVVRCCYADYACESDIAKTAPCLQDEASKCPIEALVSSTNRSKDLYLRQHPTPIPEEHSLATPSVCGARYVAFL